MKKRCRSTGARPEKQALQMKKLLTETVNAAVLRLQRKISNSGCSALQNMQTVF